jgi:hypothetical protein
MMHKNPGAKSIRPREHKMTSEAQKRLTCLRISQRSQLTERKRWRETRKCETARQRVQGCIPVIPSSWETKVAGSRFKEVREPI